MSDWQPMSSAPVNPAGEAYGPEVLIWCTADGLPWPAYYDPRYFWDDRDPGPAWVMPDSGEAIAPEDAGGWMPMPAPPNMGGDDD